MTLGSVVDVFHIRDVPVGTAGVVLAYKVAGKQDISRTHGEARNDQQQDDTLGIELVQCAPITAKRQSDAQTRRGDAQAGVFINKPKHPRKRGVNDAQRYKEDGKRTAAVGIPAVGQTNIESRDRQQQHQRNKHTRINAGGSVERGEGQTGRGEQKVGVTAQRGKRAFRLRGLRLRHWKSASFFPGKL